MGEIDGAELSLRRRTILVCLALIALAVAAWLIRPPSTEASVAIAPRPVTSSALQRSPARPAPVAAPSRPLAPPARPLPQAMTTAMDATIIGSRCLAAQKRSESFDRMLWIFDDPALADITKRKMLRLLTKLVVLEMDHLDQPLDDCERDPVEIDSVMAVLEAALELELDPDEREELLEAIAAVEGSG